MDENDIPPQLDPLSEGEQPIPPVDEAWALLRARLDIQLPVRPRHWHGHWGKWAWVGAAAVTTMVTVLLVARRPAGHRAPGLASQGTNHGKITDSLSRNSLSATGKEPGDASVSDHDKGARIVDSAHSVGRGAADHGDTEDHSGATDHSGVTRKALNSIAGQKGRPRSHSPWEPPKDAEHRLHSLAGNRQQAQTSGHQQRRTNGGLQRNTDPRLRGQRGDGQQDEANRSRVVMVQNGSKGTPVRLATTTTIPGTGWRRVADSSLRVVALSRPKTKDSTIGKKSPGNGKKGLGRGVEGPLFAMGLAAGKIFPIGGQSANNYGSNGKASTLGDYLPSLYVDYYPTKNLYLEARVAYHSPQYTHSQVIDSSGGDSSHLIGWQAYRQFNSNTLKKLFYNDIGLSVHYRVFDHLWLGAGLQISLLSGGAGYTQLTMRPTFVGGVDTVFAGKVFALKDSSSAYDKFKKADLRGFVELDYTWRRWALGLRLQQAFQSYLPTLSNGSSNPYRNGSWGIYLRYDLWQRDRRK